jgi:hypothetical protein
MTRGRKPKEEEKEEEEAKIEEEYRGRKKVCTCEEDPDFCELHVNWG